MIFNFGIENFKAYRGLASEETLSPEINKIIIDGVSDVLEGRHTEYAVDPEAEEMFVFGLLNGNYRAFKVGKNIQSIKLKSGSQAVKFYNPSEKEGLADYFRETYFNKSTSLISPDENRYVASEQVSYSIVVNKVIVGRVDFRFDSAQKLQEILVNRL